MKPWPNQMPEPTAAIAVHAVSRRLAGVVLASCFVLQGCAVFAPKTTAKARASLHAKPVVKAIENYRNAHSEYPPALSCLYPKYLETNVPLATSDWSISYQRPNPTNYTLIWKGGLSYAVYETGKPVCYGSYVGH